MAYQYPPQQGQFPGQPGQAQQPQQPQAPPAPPAGYAPYPAQAGAGEMSKLGLFGLLAFVMAVTAVVFALVGWLLGLVESRGQEKQYHADAFFGFAEPAALVSVGLAGLAAISKLVDRR